VQFEIHIGFEETKIFDVMESICYIADLFYSMYNVHWLYSTYIYKELVYTFRQQLRDLFNPLGIKNEHTMAQTVHSFSENNVLFAEKNITPKIFLENYPRKRKKSHISLSTMTIKHAFVFQGRESDIESILDCGSPNSQSQVSSFFIICNTFLQCRGSESESEAVVILLIHTG